MCLTVGLFVLMVKLGFWQLDRAEEKTDIQNQLQKRQLQPPLTYLQAIHLQNSFLTGYQLSVDGTIHSDQIILLDNQTHAGAVGYLAYQVVHIEPSLPSLLVELGFVAATPVRSVLPQVQALQGQLQLQGRLYQKSANPLSEDLLAEVGNPTRIQNLNLTQLSSLLGVTLFPAVLQPSNLPIALPQPWVPIPMSAQKHQGYALQWFSLALALLILTIIFVRRRSSKNIESQRLEQELSPETKAIATNPNPRRHDDDF